MAKKVGRAKAAKSRKARAKTAKDDVNVSAVAEHAMPGWRVVAPSGPVRSYGVAADNTGASKPAVDAVMPSTEQLHQKYFGAAGADVTASRTPTKVLDDNLAVVEMKSGDLRRSVGINKQTKKVEWSQG